MHLTDFFMELVAYVVYFQKTAANKQPPYEQVKADILRLLNQSEKCRKSGAITPEDSDQARFVICAWADEVILGSSWVHKPLWQREQLQRIYYNTTDAGEEVFGRLNVLGLHQRDVREVFYLCLALGFKGRFVKPGDEFLLEQLKTSNLKLLLGSAISIPSLETSELFPDAYPEELLNTAPKKKSLRFSISTAAVFGGPLLLFGLLFLIYWFTLSGVGESFIRMVLS